MGWRNKYRVHPTADVLPMMSDEELAELGEDIKSNGLKEPITFDREGVLLDGRNRLEAMERAGIAPALLP
jgi:ParB-like chromosome segregation protein Spo0J